MIVSNLDGLPDYLLFFVLKVGLDVLTIASRSKATLLRRTRRTRRSDQFLGSEGWQITQIPLAYKEWVLLPSLQQPVIFCWIHLTEELDLSVCVSSLCCYNHRRLVLVTDRWSSSFLLSSVMGLLYFLWMLLTVSCHVEGFGVSTKRS